MFSAVLVQGQVRSRAHAEPVARVGSADPVVVGASPLVRAHGEDLPVDVQGQGRVAAGVVARSQTWYGVGVAAVAWIPRPHIAIVYESSGWVLRSGLD